HAMLLHDPIRDAIENSDAMAMQGMKKTQYLYYSVNNHEDLLERYRALAATVTDKRAAVQKNINISDFCLGIATLFGGLILGASAYFSDKKECEDGLYAGCGFGIGMGALIINRSTTSNKNRYYQALAIEQLLRDP